MRERRSKQGPGFETQNATGLLRTVSIETVPVSGCFFTVSPRERASSLLVSLVRLKVLHLLLKCQHLTSR